MKANTNESGLRAPDRDGFAMVTTLLVVLVLSVLAVGVAWIATSEKKTSFAEGVHVRSTFAADAGGEAGINFIRMSMSPPIVDFANGRRVHDQATTALQGSQTYEYEAALMVPPAGAANPHPKPGWDPKYYLDFDYEVDALGRSSATGQAGVDLVVSRLYKIGY